MQKLERNELSAKYCYNSIVTKRSGAQVDRLGNTLFNSKIKLTPHQIQAALFAFRSPLSKGVILADEVGLGKTIEAGIVISQTWFEKRGKVLIIAPASLIKQWQGELAEKFGLQSAILDRKSYNIKLKAGFPMPINGFEENILICSYQMCNSFKEDIRNTNFDLVVIDEAHKLRNVYNESSITANGVKFAIANFKKVLLTATPIQNNLMDIFGICSIIDEDLFGDKSIFRKNYIKDFTLNEEDLEQRLKNVLHRTLRKQVQPYIQFTNRIPKTFSFSLSKDEEKVYEKIQQLINSSDEDSYLIPKSQKHLLLLILCKLMGSSMEAISFTLEKMKSRLISLRETGKEIEMSLEEFGLDDDETDESILFDYDPENLINFEKLDAEIENLDSIINLAKNVKTESKYVALKSALEYSFNHLKELGAEDKVLIFTESRRTQDYLLRQLTEDGYEDILLYNGTNSDSKSQAIYDEWIKKECNSDKVSGNKAINMRAAILEKFKESGKILIATEAGAEGLNLQFCSLVINYDLPWNPQKVEQRIGRCHRFGQKYDVVVINFINSNNAVEQHIYELLNSKFNLFDQVLGSSDNVLGTIEDGKDIEKAILKIYATCRTTEEINKAFNELQDMYKDDIETSVNKAKKELLENFEEDVQKYFEDIMSSTVASISNVERLVWHLLQDIWGSDIIFGDNFTFKYHEKTYCLSSRNSENKWIDFNLNTSLGKKLENECASITRTNGTIKFNISNYPFKLSRIEKLKGKSGYITIKKVDIDSFEQEEYLVCNGIMDDGQRIESDMIDLLFRLNTEEYADMKLNDSVMKLLEQDSTINVQSVINDSQLRNNEYLKEEIAKINAWADDKIQAVQLDVENMRKQRKELQIESDSATNLEEKENIEKQILALSKKIRQSWLNLAMTEEELEEERKDMIAAIKKENMKKTECHELITARFEVI